MQHYKVSCNERVKNLEKFLEDELLELKNEIEETDMLYGNWSKPISSVLLPKNINYYREERSRTISKMLDVSDAPQLKNQSQVMMSELETALKSDITDESLPLLLHQFFLDRVQSLVQCKHLHLLRWRRFCQHTAAVERLYPEYCKRLESIDQEYKDAKQRAFRLSAAHTAFINKDKEPMRCVESDDIMIYLRWLITNLRCVRKSLSYMRILQWFPITHRNSIDSSGRMEAKPAGSIDDMENIELQMPSESEFSMTSASHLLASQASKSLDKAFTGLVSNELTQSIPVHTLDLSNFREQLEALAIEYGITIKSDLATSADEMELFGAVNRQFKRLFNLQEECSTFYPYDFVPEGNEHWGIDSPTHCLMKPCNWTSHMNILPHKDALQEKQVKQLKQSNNMDELLESHSRFLGVSDYSLVVESLKLHASAVQKPPTAKALQVTTHRQGALRSTDIWLQIYNNPELYKDFGSADKDSLSGAGDTGSSGAGFTRSSGRKESYDFSNTMQLLGLDESEDTTSSDINVVQGAYLSFLHLRILKLRDIRRQCLALFNYFRSVERTVTIYDGGLSLEDETSSQEQVERKGQKDAKGSSKLKRHGSQKAQVNKTRGGRGKTRGFGSHHYISNTPLDFKIDESEFMEFSGVANHDDFYQLEEEDGNEDEMENEKQTNITASVKKGHYVPHVQDQRGYYIMYEHAMKDLKATEKDLLLVASFYINKDQDHRTSVTQSSRKRAFRSNEAAGEVNLSAYAHRDVDRFAVLLDAWTCELNFLHNKRELLDCYLESYHNTFDPKERHDLAQAMTDVIHLRPRYDLQQDYFIKTYKLECTCLRLKTNLMTQILNKQIEEGRQYVCCLPRDEKAYGLPFPIILKQPVAVNLPRPALMHVHMFEFHPTLGATASRVSETLRHAIREFIQAYKPASQIQAISIEKQVLELANHEWDEMTEPGTSFSTQVQKELFSGQYSDDPGLIKEAVESLLAGQTEEVDTETMDEKRKRATKAWKTALDAIFLQHRLQQTAWETEILSRIYKHTSEEMGFGDYHMYLRLSQFEFASPKQKADPLPSSITKFVPDDSAADRYVPNHLVLAVHELDEKHMPKFSYHDKTSFMTILMESNVLENIRIALACQIAHRNSLVIAVTQAVTCMQWKDPSLSSHSVGKKGSVLDASDSHSTHSYSSAITQGSNRSGAVSPGGGTARGQPAPQTYSSKLTFGFERQKKMNEPFLSIQLEKLGPRDAMVNNFIKKKETSGMLLQRESELQKLKRQFVTDFCKVYSFRMGLHAMRAQIVACYSSILSLLDDFPTIRDTHFVLGRPNEKKRKLDDVEGLMPDPKTLHRRPRRVLSTSGTDLLNLWFIPHYTEVLFAFRNKDYSTQQKILTCWLEMVSSFHDILQCLHAHARLGNLQNSKDKKTGFVVAADWGGTEGVGAELSEIQKQLENLSTGTTPHTRDPFQVADFLRLRKDVMFLEFDAAVRYYVRKLFLETDNKSAYDAVTAGMHFAIPSLNDTLQQSLFQFFLHVPEPLDADEETAQRLYPWLSFEDSHGAFPLMYRSQWRDVENCMQVCLASLDDSERQRANGEILGTCILYQDVLQGGVLQLQSLHELPEASSKGFIVANPLGGAHHSGARPTSAAVVPDKSKAADEDDDDDDANKKSRKPSSSKSEQEAFSQPLSKMEQPVSSYKLIKVFFLLCKQLEMLKEDWSAKKLFAEKIDTPTLLLEAKRIYVSEFYLPVLQSIARDMGLVDYYSELMSLEDVVMPPRNAPEITIRARQVMKLLEVLECQMLQDVRHKVSQEMSLVLAERSREETALPTDLWKKPSIRETFTVNRPSIVEDFLHGLMSDYTEENGKTTFSTEHLNKCVFDLASRVMKREKQNYEMYSTFYENILHHHHQLLYQKEQELRAVLSKSSNRHAGSQIQAQFQLADRSHELILEVTALRAAITEMREQNLHKEQAVRQEVQKEYQELVQRLFEECFQMKSELAQHHLSLHENVHLLISETRRESMEMLENLRNKNLNFAVDERLKILQAKDDQLKKSEEEKSSLNITLSKLLALNHWRRSTSKASSTKNIQKLSQELSRCKKELQSLQLMSSQNKTLLEEQLQSARKAFELANLRLKKVYDRMEREQRAQKEQEYRDAKEERNRQQLAEAQKKNLDRMVIELEEKDKRLRAITAENEKSSKINEVSSMKVQRKVKTIQTQLATDRSLKLEAFNRVDDLQAHIWDFEHAQMASAGSIAPSMSRATSANTSRAKSAFGLHSILNGVGPPSIISISSPPYTPRVKTRPLSSMPAYAGTSYDDTQTSLLQRPKTSSARIKTKIASTLISTTVGRVPLEELSTEQK